MTLDQSLQPPQYAGRTSRRAGKRFHALLVRLVESQRLFCVLLAGQSTHDNGREIDVWYGLRVVQGGNHVLSFAFKNREFAPHVDISILQIPTYQTWLQEAKDKS